MTLTAAERTAAYAARFRAVHGISYKVARRRHRQGPRFCKRCGKPIDLLHGLAKYCGKKCKKMYQHNPNAPVIVACRFCLKDFDVSHGKQRYCSEQCRRLLKNEAAWERRNGVKT